LHQSLLSTYDSPLSLHLSLRLILSFPAENPPFSQILPIVELDSLPLHQLLRGIMNSTVSYEHRYTFFGFSFPFVLLLGSVCEAYTGRLSCFRAQVNMPYRIVSCHSTVFTVHTRTLSLTSSQPHPSSAAREGIRSDLIHGSLVSEMTYTVSGGR